MNDNTFLDWAIGNRSDAVPLSRFLQEHSVKKVMRDIEGSIRGSEYLDRPLRNTEAADLELDRLWHLENNWDSYGADAPNNAAISSAREFLRELARGDLPYTRILPSAEGGVAVVFFNGNKRAIAEFLNDGTRDLMLYDISGALFEIEPTNQTSEAYREAIRAFLFCGEDR